MANETTMTPEDARQYLVTQIYAPVFFSKLASAYGIEPRDEAEAEALLRMGSKLAQAHAQDMAKSAQAAGSFLSEAEAGLDRALQAYGFNEIPGHEDSLVKQAAAEWAADPAVQEAVLVFHNALSQEIQEQPGRAS